MSTMNILLSKSLKSLVESQAATGGYSTSSEYVREPIRKDRDRQSLRAMVLKGAASTPVGLADADYFDRLRSRVREAGR